MKLVPSPLLLAVVALAAIPALTFALAAYMVIPSVGVLAVMVAVAGFDAMGGARRLRSVSATGPALVRLWKDREGEFDLTLNNAARTQRTIRVGLAFPDAISTPEETREIELPPGTERSHVTWKCTGRRRGKYAVEHGAIEISSPLRLWLVRKRTPVETEIRVYPTLTSEQKKAPYLFMRRAQVGLHIHRQVGKGREFEKLREYMPGDGFDEIDWKATARRGHPITRVFQVERTQEVYVILDASRLTARPVEDGGATILERNVTASLLLALAAEKRGDLFGLVTFSDRVHSFVRARSGKAHYGACRDALYALEPRIVSPDWDDVCTMLRLRLRRRALLVFLTELDDPVLAESFQKNVSLLRRQHLVMVGMARPREAQPAFEDSLVDNLADVYGRLAGQILWTKLRELGKTLERQGVRFALLEPGRAGVQLASLYADIKQRQLL
ncbi:MAG TPA: DUF58 domain-containing protein [Bryobacteraceae bacterium]|nr:DUF58 domain-containing protein [Bryobacteraceae bacterium]